MSAELVVAAGIRLSKGFSLDTENLEISVKGAAGPRVGLAAGVAYNGSIQASPGDAPVSEVTTDIVVNADANAGPASIGGDIVSSKNGEVKTLTGDQVGIGLGDAGVELKPQVKFGASVGVEISGEATSAVIPKIKDLTNGGSSNNRPANNSDNGMSSRIMKICSGMGAQRGGC